MAKNTLCNAYCTKTNETNKTTFIQGPMWKLKWYLRSGDPTGQGWRTLDPAQD